MEHLARLLPDEAGQSFGRVQERGRRMHQSGGVVLLPAAPIGNGHSPSYQWAAFGSLRAGVLLARRQPAGQQRHAMEMDHGRRARPRQERAVGWLLAQERRMTEHLDELPIVAIAALSRKRAEIAGKITALLRQIADLRADLLHIDHTLRMIDPTYSPNTKAARVRFSTIGYFERGELSRRIY